MRILIFVISFSVSFSVTGQVSDFIILKKKDKTVKSYYTGTQIEFVTTSGVYRNGVITKVQNDSIFLREYIVRQGYTSMGFYVLDTAGSVSYAYPYKDIRRIGKESKGFNWSGSGAALLGGGILLTLASGVVYLADRDKFSPELLGAAAGLGIIGYFISKASGKGIVIGKKNYRLEYMKLNSD